MSALCETRRSLRLCVENKPHPISQAGFTLMELLVASVITSVVLAGIYSAFSTAILSWRIGEAGVRNFQGARISMAMLERELQCAVPGAAYLFEGGERDLTFYAVARPLDVETGEHPRILRIRYRLKEDPSGEDRILVREEAEVEGALPVNRDGIETERLKLGPERTFELAENIKNLRFSYHWLPSDDANPASQQPLVMTENRKGWGQPQAVRVELIVADPNAEDGRARFNLLVTFQGPTTRLEGNRPGEGGGL